jgi:hypothetical protein
LGIVSLCTDRRKSSGFTAMCLTLLQLREGILYCVSIVPSYGRVVDSMHYCASGQYRGDQATAVQGNGTIESLHALINGRSDAQVS